MELRGRSVVRCRGKAGVQVFYVGGSVVVHTVIGMECDLFLGREGMDGRPIHTSQGHTEEDGRLVEKYQDEQDADIRGPE